MRNFESERTEKAGLDRGFGARFWVAVILVLLAALLRLLPHPDNFSPIAGMALLAGALFARPVWAIVVPLGAMLISDLALGFHSQMPGVYGAILLVSVLGLGLRSRRRVWPIAGAAVGSSVLFFLVTNFSVWTEGELYPRTWAGLESCFIAAIPFFRNSLAGDLFWTAALFGAWAMLESVVPKLAPNSANRS